MDVIADFARDIPAEYKEEARLLYKKRRAELKLMNEQETGEITKKINFVDSKNKNPENFSSGFDKKP